MITEDTPDSTPSSQLEIEWPAIGQRWRHYKGGVYTITGFEFDSEDGNLRVCYTASDGVPFSRPLADWLGCIKANKRTFRFTLES